MFFPRLLKPGSEAPDFSVLDQHAMTCTLETLTAGGATGLLVFYYHYDSPVCRNFLSTLADSHNELAEKNIRMLALNPLDWEYQRKMATDINLPFPVGYDPMSRFARLYGTCLYKSFWTARAVYAINNERKIIFRQNGFPKSRQGIYSVLSQLWLAKQPEGL